jgi:CRP/FNR family transcriptional regulator, cyclic AMP receptor protein
LPKGPSSTDFAISGRIKLANTNIGGKEVVLHYVGEGEIFGEIVALDGEERAADAVALEECQIFFLYTRELLPTLTAHPPAMLEILLGLCEKIRVAATIIEDNKLEMRWRTARGLLRLARQHGRTATAGGSLQLAISQEELGKYLGATRANVNRQLGELKSAKLITISGTEITIVDAEELEEIANNPSHDRELAHKAYDSRLGVRVVKTPTPGPAPGIRPYRGNSGLARSGQWHVYAMGKSAACALEHRDEFFLHRVLDAAAPDPACPGG